MAITACNPETVAGFPYIIWFPLLYTCSGKIQIGPWPVFVVSQLIQF